MRYSTSANGWTAHICKKYGLTEPNSLFDEFSCPPFGITPVRLLLGMRYERDDIGVLRQTQPIRHYGWVTLAIQRGNAGTRLHLKPTIL